MEESVYDDGSIRYSRVLARVVCVVELPHSTDEGRSIKRFLAQSRVLLAGSVSSQPSSLSYLVRLPPEAGNQNRYRYRLLAAHRPRQLAIALGS